MKRKVPVQMADEVPEVPEEVPEGSVQMADEIPEGSGADG